ncbi:S41 family peptidase [Pararhodonellum marinum]|uniref:S41 family peptidase n=1 Tax=Pararhodonellum marinum TaxID=2755358 RepID=UPI00188DD757|nr:S41 family peptidase [Pararhodonellum marinum]
MKTKNYLWFAFGLVLLAFTSCNQDDQPQQPPQGLTLNEEINTWIQDVMDQVYYFLEDMRPPISKTADPEAYFDALLANQDQFSVIYPDFQELMNSLQGIETEAGYEFILRGNQQNNDVIAEVTYIKRGSPAAGLDIKRGDRITQFNGRGINQNNFREFLNEIRTPHSIDYLRFDESVGGFVPKPTLDVSTSIVSENPNFLDTIYTVGNQKIGYVVYHFFAPGTESDPNRFDAEMDNIFGHLKSQGINHLIVDFRYNSGGFVSSAVNLASLIGPGVSSSDIFSKTKYNSFLSQFSDFQNVQTRFRDKSPNLGNTLSDNRLYVLTTSRTASASELIINGLRPYMDVFLIGTRTVGKNLGSVPIDDDENPENNYGLLPIISQSFNSLDESDYGDGFVPDIEVNELSERLLPFGDTNDILLRTAISQITGEPSLERFQQWDPSELGSTMDRKIRSGKLIETLEK